MFKSDNIIKSKAIKFIVKKILPDYKNNGTISDKILKDRAYEIARNRNYDGYQRALASMVHKFLIRKQDQERE